MLGHTSRECSSWVSGAVVQLFENKCRADPDYRMNYNWETISEMVRDSDDAPVKDIKDRSYGGRNFLR